MSPAVASVAAADTPFHAGERAAQARMGVEGVEDWARKVVRPFMPDQHREFFEMLPFAVVGLVDEQGREKTYNPAFFDHAQKNRV